MSNHNKPSDESISQRSYRVADFCHEDFNVASHGISKIKIRYIFLSRDFLSREIL